MHPAHHRGNLLPIHLATRPSQRGPLAEANGRRLSIERANDIARVVLVVVCAAVLVTLAIRGC